MSDNATTSAAVDRMLEEVAADTGLDDYGDPSFRDGLEQVWASGTTQAGLSELGRGVLVGQCRGNLANRLRVTDWHRRHPEAASEEAVEQPIFIVGLSRTGTTALSHLLACDPANRSLLGWEAGTSVPPPDRETYADDPRFVAAREADGMLGLLNPGFKAIHHDPPDRPVGVRGAPRATLPLREPVDVLQRSRLRRLDARGRRPSPRTRTTGRCCRCSSRRIPDSGSSSRRCTASSSTRSPTRIPTRASW